MAVLLFGVYLGGWRPARGWLMQEAVYPLLTARAAQQPDGFVVAPGADPLTVQIRSARTGAVVSDYRAPAGILFLLSALFLIILFPLRPYWLYYGGLHMGLGLMSLAAIMVGMGGTDWGFVVQDFLDKYMIPAVSLAVPPLVWHYSRRPVAATEAGLPVA